MAQCSFCKSKGWLLSVNHKGLCDRCRVVYENAIMQHGRILSESLELAHTGKTIATRLSRCDLVVEHAGYLLQYEEAGIPTLEPSPSEIIDSCAELRDRIFAGEYEDIVKKAVNKSKIAATVRTKISALRSAQLKISGIQTDFESEFDASEYENGLSKMAATIEYEGYVEAANKAEFKGNKKKAIDQYQEALYFLKTDDISDEEQGGQIAMLESKIEELKGK